MRSMRNDPNADGHVYLAKKAAVLIKPDHRGLARRTHDLPYRCCLWGGAILGGVLAVAGVTWAGRGACQGV